MSQTSRLLNYLVKQHRASTNQIRNQLDIECPSSAVSILRKQYGRDAIKSIPKKGRKNRYGERKRYTMYELTEWIRLKLEKPKPAFPSDRVFKN